MQPASSRLQIITLVVAIAAVVVSGYRLSDVAVNQQSLDLRAEWMIRTYIANEIKAADRLTRTDFERSRKALVKLNGLKPVDVPRFELEWVHSPFPPVSKAQWDATVRRMVDEGYPVELIPEFGQ